MSFQIAVLKGDGIGLEIVDAALQLLSTLQDNSDFTFSTKEAPMGADAIDKTGSPYPDETHRVCASSDAVLLGAIGDPKYDNDPEAKVRPEQGLLAMRKQLGVFANIRPVRLFDGLENSVPLKPELVKDLDILFVRELTGGIYFGQPSAVNEDFTEAVDTCRYTRAEIERIAKIAFERAQQRKKKVTLVDKANVLATSQLWRKVTAEVHADFPDVELNQMYVDNAAMQLIMNPTQFDVVLTENMFGDILSDEASILGGSLGLLPSASLGTSTSVYEPAHGSFPQAAGKNIANPMATLLSVAMMLEIECERTDLATAIRESIQECITTGKTTSDILNGKESTTSVTDAICALVAEKLG